MAYFTHMRLTRLLNAPVLVAVNAAIIIACETVGQGKFFEESGLIHGIAVLFIVLAAVRIMTRYYLFDPELRVLLHASLFAMGVFALSHVVEFASFKIFHGYSDEGFANVINFYAISLLAMLYGAETAVVRYRKAGEWKLGALSVAITALLVLSALFTTRSLPISLEPDRLAPYVYAGLIILVWALCLARWREIRRMYGWFSGFVSNVMLSAFMVLLAAMPNIFYEALEGLGMPERQSIYLSHFTFYAALSVMVLAYDRVQRIGGLHKDLREQLQKEAA